MSIGREQTSRRTNLTGESFLITPPATGWSWINQGSATETALSDGSILMKTPAVGVTNLVGRVRSYTAPLKVRARIAVSTLGGTSGGSGLWFRESSTGELHAFYHKDIGGIILMENWSSATSFSSGPLTASMGTTHTFWLEIEDNDTNLFFRVSADGHEESYLELGSVGRTSFMAGGPNQWGWFVRDNNFARNISLSSWYES